MSQKRCPHCGREDCPSMLLEQSLFGGETENPIEALQGLATMMALSEMLSGRGRPMGLPMGMMAPSAITEIGITADGKIVTRHRGISRKEVEVDTEVAEAFQVVIDMNRELRNASKQADELSNEADELRRQANEEEIDLRYKVWDAFPNRYGNYHLSLEKRDPEGEGEAEAIWLIYDGQAINKAEDQETAAKLLAEQEAIASKRQQAIEKDNEAVRLRNRVRHEPGRIELRDRQARRLLKERHPDYVEAGVLPVINRETEQVGFIIESPVDEQTDGDEIPEELKMLLSGLAGIEEKSSPNDQPGRIRKFLSGIPGMDKLLSGKKPEPVTADEDTSSESSDEPATASN